MREWIQRNLSRNLIPLFPTSSQSVSQPEMFHEVLSEVFSGLERGIVVVGPWVSNGTKPKTGRVWPHMGWYICSSTFPGAQLARSQSIITWLSGVIVNVYLICYVGGVSGCMCSALLVFQCVSYRPARFYAPCDLYYICNF